MGTKSEKTASVTAYRMHRVVDNGQRNSRELDPAAFRVLNLATEAVIGPGGRGLAQHHQGITRSAHEIVTFLHNLPILPMIQTKFLPPVVEMLEDLEASRLHPLKHVD